MKLSILAAIAAVVIALSFASSASAQFEAADKSPLGVALSVFRPSGTELKDLGSNWLGASLFWQMGFDDFDRPNSTISVGWFGSDNATSKANLVPLRASYIRRFGGEDSCWYVGAGLGLDFVHFERAELLFDPTNGYSYGTASDNGTKLGGSLSFGREFGGGWFFELRKDMVGSLRHQTGGSIDFNGWSINVGSRLAY